MLVEFSIKNFRSIKDRVTFSMVATSDDTLSNNLIKKVLKKDNLLRSAVLYGPNAAGKSNIVRALNLLAAFVRNSHTHQQGGPLRFEFFRMDKKFQNKPTEFSLLFISKGVTYRYEVSQNDKEFVKENLYHYPNGSKAIIFERKNKRFVKDKRKQEKILERTLPNTLYLSKAAQDNYAGVSGAFNWFSENLRAIISDETKGDDQDTRLRKHLSDVLSQYPKDKEIILRALTHADFSIDDISVDKLEPVIPVELARQLQKIPGLQIGHVSKKVQVYRKGVPFDLDQDESRGTKRFLSLIVPWIDCLTNGRVLVFDELESRLHPALTTFLINLFNDPKQNKKNAQLIFTTHDISLLGGKLLRRDQIWLVEKNPKSLATDLYSLVEYKPRARKDKRLLKGYLEGRFGAMPSVDFEGVLR